MSWRTRHASRRSALTLLGLGATTPLLGSCSAASADAEHTIVAAHATSTDHHHHESFELFKQLVEENSDGRIRMQIFTNGVFGGDRELTEGVQLDTIQLAAPSSSPVATFAPLQNVWDMPYLFDDRDHAARVLDGEFGQRLLAQLAEVRLMALGYWENGIRQLTSNDREVHSPEDLRGLKIRTLENAVQLRAWNATGASATPMAFTEVYTGLQQGTIDAQENPLALIVTQKFYEVQRHLILSSHLYSPSPLVMSRSFFERLPSDLQDVVLDAGQQTVDFCRERSIAYEQESEQTIRDAGVAVTSLDASERDAFREVMLPPAESYVRSLIGDETVDELAGHLEDAR